MYNHTVASLINSIKTQNPDLKTSEIEGFLYLILTEEGLTNTDLVTKTGFPKETVKNFKKSISNLLENPSGETVKLSTEGRKLVEEAGPKPHKFGLFNNYFDYKSPLSSTIPVNNQNSVLIRKFSDLAKDSVISPKREFDQFISLPETSVSKALIVQEMGLLKESKIALLGDDDLVSAALSILGGFTELVVFDIDQSILSAVEKIKTTLNIKNIRTQVCDFRKSIKPEFQNKFDLVITDPPYTKSGVALFLNRAVQLLRTSDNFEGKYIFLYYGNSFKTPEKTLKIQEIINKFNLVIEDKVDKFARYAGADSIGNSSSLYILKTTKFTKPVDETSLSVPIYTYENQKEEKFPYVSHTVAKILGVPKNIISSRALLLRFLGKFCSVHKLKVVDKKETKFKNEGYSFTFILSNSNLLVHTWPEYSAIHIDLVTCAPLYKKEFLGKTLAELFAAKNVEIREIE